MKRVGVGAIAVCSVVKAELIYGAHRSAHPPDALRELAEFFRSLRSLPFDDLAAEHYGEIRAFLAKAGKPIGANDLFIAAIARTNGVTLVTHNTSEFGRVPGLLLEDWQE